MTKIYITLVDIDEHDTEELAPDPMDVYIQKIETLAELLGCTEEQAERIILERI